MGKTFVKVSVSDIATDPSYQRDIDEGRVAAMARNFEEARIGVPSLSHRKDGTYVVLDGQHRVSAMRQAGMETTKILCEVHSGLTLSEEAELFLKLNNGRKSIQVFDKYKARMIAKESTAVEFTSIIHSLGLRIGRTPVRNTIMALQSVESVHKRGRNLEATLSVLKRWGGGDCAAFDGTLIKNVSNFLLSHPEASPDELLEKIQKHEPEYVIRKIKGMCDVLDGNRKLAADHVLREIYNRRRQARDKLAPVSARASA